ncbi:hypothetical protein [Synechococcus sp. PROS-U-1]|uniref:hypothetical protein n=1 Tax=Synechococcus sp. PROS-U-1 TaxID=1400866 RepID=UPI001647FAA8|nr:hypothetical protein [Synechococcus sp. PROS-U-1]QNJ03739.1 hypothetical protein SynPROSU1_02143 [Synechococcus sp. PROS-U-1]
MTTTTERISIEDFIEAVIADRVPFNAEGNLSDEVCEAGLYLWDIAVDSLPEASSLCIAPSGFCSDLDLPQGSTWTECLAAALDIHPQFNGTNRLSMISQLINEHGLNN